MAQQTIFDPSMADYIPYRVIRGGAVVAMGTLNDCNRASEKIGGRVERFHRGPEFVHIRKEKARK